MQKYESELDSLYVYDDGAVKGFIKIEGTYIAKLFVEPVLQNASIGSQLLEYAVKEHGADHLWALEKNTKAIRFYERHGFFATGQKKPEDGTSEYLIMILATGAARHLPAHLPDTRDGSCATPSCSSA